ncbi:fimbrial protein [Stenotrophomonas pavanii]|uniref:fimbrial protein n=1 Tax=Stenotrophomonas pavanii TaxID=487698 RepID=UPI002E795184|nr:fimbrial protein [Stenotrophomonas pavanii]
MSTWLAPRNKPPRRRAISILAFAFTALMAASGAAQACQVKVQAPIVVDRDRSGYTEDVRMIWDEGTNASISGCPISGLLDLQVDLQGADLRWVGDIDFGAYPVIGKLPVYEASPDSALMGFGLMTDGASVHPFRLGSNAVQFSANRNVIPLLFVFSRGSKMADFQTQVAMQLSAPAHPAFGDTVPISITMRFPPTTCRMQDVSAVLQDVSLEQLANAGDTAMEKQVSLLMDCGIVKPRADIVLNDAGDFANTGSMLTPSADSTAEGVRVQLLSGAGEVQFGTPWFFNPGGGGVHAFTYTARYIRTNEALKPGVIKGEAVLNVDYW